MACDICKRSSCTRSLHSLQEQEAFDNPQASIDSLLAENARLKEALTKLDAYLDFATPLESSDLEIEDLSGVNEAFEVASKAMGGES